MGDVADAWEDKAMEERAEQFTGWEAQGLFEPLVNDPLTQQRKDNKMRLSVNVVNPTVSPTPPEIKQMQVGILYYHELTGSIILCTQARQPKTSLIANDSWISAKGICLVKGKLNRREWSEYPVWSFMEPANYKPFRGALRLQNEFRAGEG